MSDLPSADRPPRLVPDEPFPAYSYVTGRFPHPTRDPAGHSYAHTSAEPAPLTTRDGRVPRAYLLGCDLFNYGYYWEAHEAWEGHWHACGRRGTAADFLKGLIKLAAAGVKAREGRPHGIARHAERAEKLFRRVRSQIDGSDYFGLNVERLIDLASDLIAHVQPVDGDKPVEIVFDFVLVPDAR